MLQFQITAEIYDATVREPWWRLFMISGPTKYSKGPWILSGRWIRRGRGWRVIIDRIKAS